MSEHRQFSRSDPFWMAVETTLEALWGHPAGTGRPSPAAGLDATLSSTEKRKAAQLLRVDHAGEVCAQGLYQGQAWSAKDPKIQQHFLASAAEEEDHLRWCAGRLSDLKSHPSYLNPLWYAGSFTIGVIVGRWGDGWNLGFMAETERQVDLHLAMHLTELPIGDHPSRAVLAQMQVDEREHASAALAAGGRRLPLPARLLMQATSKIMTSIAKFI